MCVSIYFNHITDAFKANNLNNLGAWPWMALLFYGNDDEIYPGCGKRNNYMHSFNDEFDKKIDSRW